MTGRLILPAGTSPSQITTAEPSPYVITQSCPQHFSPALARRRSQDLSSRKVRRAHISRPDPQLQVIPPVILTLSSGAHSAKDATHGIQLLLYAFVAVICSIVLYGC